MTIREATVENPLRLAVFISGSGSGMAALLRHQESKPCLHETTLVVSNVADVSGLAKAAAHNVKTITIELEATISDAKERRETHETAIMAALEQHNIEAVILSGYMRILSPLFVRAWKGRLLNIHPSLLPKYPGAHAHRDALADGATVTGCTVHLVDEGVDQRRSEPLSRHVLVHVFGSHAKRVRIVPHGNTHLLRWVHRDGEEQRAPTVWLSH
mgnify:CR=1 FL=1